MPTLDKAIVKKYIEEVIAELLDNQTARRFQHTREWAKRAPASAGVYTIFEDNVLIYVGETGCIQKRMMDDLLNTRHHSLRRSLGADLFRHETDYQPATTRNNFPPRIEELLKNYMEEHLSVNTMVVPFGRLEIEETIIGQEPIPKYNKKSKRSED